MQQLTVWLVNMIAYRSCVYTPVVCRCYSASVSTECFTKFSSWCRISLPVRADSSW